MHELSLAAEILAIVEGAAQRDSFERVAALELEAGALAGVDVRALRFALGVLAPGTVLEGAVLNITEPEGRAFCGDCTETVPLAARGDPCPSCGGYGLRPVSGTELRVRRLTVHDD